MDTPQPHTDVFIYRSAAHNIPDWIALDTALSFEVRNLAHRIIIGPNGAAQPSLEYYADIIGVTPRTAYRYIELICKAGYCKVQRLGRRTFYQFYEHAITDLMKISNPKPTTDLMTISDPHEISDRHEISSRDAAVSDFSGNTTPENNTYPQNPITDLVHGGGDGSISSKKEITPSPNTPPRTKVLPSHISTPLGIEMVREWGWSLRAAFEFQNVNAEAARSDRARLKSLGKDEGQVILSWRVSPPKPKASSLAPVQQGPIDAAEIRRMYGDLFNGDNPRDHLERSHPDVDNFEQECGL